MPLAFHSLSIAACRRRYLLQQSSEQGVSHFDVYYYYYSKFTTSLLMYSLRSKIRWLAIYSRGFVLVLQVSRDACSF